MIALAALIVLALLTAAAIVWRRRARRSAGRRTLDALAVQFAFKRLPTETDEELRARIRAMLPGSGGAPSFGRAGLRDIAVHALWKRGYPRAEVDISNPEFGLVRAHVRAKVPASVLCSVERDLQREVPMSLSIEVTAEGEDSR